MEFISEWEMVCPKCRKPFPFHYLWCPKCLQHLQLESIGSAGRTVDKPLDSAKSKL